MPLALTTVFADLPDPRVETTNELHKLIDILVIATCAVIAGADGWEDIAEYGDSKEDFFRRFLELPNGVPSHDTFERVFARLDPDAFADRFGRWMAELCDSVGLTHAAVDGKSARRSPKDTFTGCLHRVSAWAVENRRILGQRSVPAVGHEITTVPDLLAALDLRGAVATLDAVGCQKATAAQIRNHWGIENGRHWVLGVAGARTTAAPAPATRRRIWGCYGGYGGRVAGEGAVGERIDHEIAEAHEFPGSTRRCRAINPATARAFSSPTASSARMTFSRRSAG